MNVKLAVRAVLAAFGASGVVLDVVAVVTAKNASR